jgi:hypothetical protein
MSFRALPFFYDFLVSFPVNFYGAVCTLEAIHLFDTLEFGRVNLTCLLFFMPY